MREEEIRRSDLLEESNKLYVVDMKKLAIRHRNGVQVSCPACGSEEYNNIFNKYECNFDTCLVCETIFVNPRATDKSLFEYYVAADYYKYWVTHIFPESEDARRSKIVVPRVDRILEICKKYSVETGTILEAGAGFGTFSQEISSRRIFKNILSVEPIPELAEKCRSRGLSVIESGIENCKLEKNSIDVIASYEVIEHLFSPYNFLLKCEEFLKPGGIVILTCPNVKGFDIAPLGGDSDSFDIEHINYFHTKSINILLERCGFEVVELSTPGKLDAELLRKRVLAKQYDLSCQPFLNEVLVERWEELGAPFQDFLSENLLSSHMWIVGQKKIKSPGC